MDLSSIKAPALAVFVLVSPTLLAQNLPVFTSQPTSLVALPGDTVILAASAGSATGYQWRFNGADIPWGTNSTLRLTNVQGTASGYYMVVAKNDAGWVPSRLAYVSLDYTLGGTAPNGAGTLSFSNTNNTFYRTVLLP